MIAYAKREGKWLLGSDDLCVETFARVTRYSTHVMAIRKSPNYESLFLMRHLLFFLLRKKKEKDALATGGLRTAAFYISYITHPQKDGNEVIKMFMNKYAYEVLLLLQL